MSTYTYKSGDDTPVLTETLERDGDRIDLSNASTVRVYADDGNGNLVINDTATIEDAAAGEISFDPPALNLDDGRYRLEFLVEFSDGSKQSVPATSFFDLRIEETTARNQTAEDLDAAQDATVTKLTVDEVEAKDGTSVSILDDVVLQGGLEMGQNPITNVKYEEVASESDIPSGDTGWFYVADVDNLVYKH